METDKQSRKKQKLDEQIEEYRKWREVSSPNQHWRAWGSWFSWGSPVGLGLFFALCLLSLGVFIWLIKL